MDISPAGLVTLAYSDHSAALMAESIARVKHERAVRSGDADAIAAARRDYEAATERRTQTQGAFNAALGSVVLAR